MSEMAKCSRLDVSGVRVSQSYSRGEVWLLKQILLSLGNPVRLQELSSDPYYGRLARKSAALLKRADDEAAAVTVIPKRAPAALIERNRRIRADAEAVIRSGRPFICYKYAAIHGLSERIVSKATEGVRAAAKRQYTPAVAEEVYQAYKMLRAAKMWHWSLRTAFATYLRVPLEQTRAQMGAWADRYMAETTEKQRRIAVNVEAAEPLFRQITDASENHAQEAAE